MIQLDDPQALAALDPGGMLRQVADLPGQLERAATLRPVVATGVAALREEQGGKPWGHALLCGMGGSAIGGDYAAAWSATQGLRLHVHRGYGLPPWVNEETLLVFSSYSGSTEETLSAYGAAPRAAPRLCITTGGELQRRAQDDTVPVVTLPPGLQPRAALGHSLVALLLALDAVGWLNQSPLPELLAAARRLQAWAPQLAPDVPEARNRAKQLARACANHLTWMWTGNGVLEPVGRRWRAQWNENGKTLALHSVLPEMCHNEIMAAPRPANVCAETRVVALLDADDPAPVRRRMQLLEELMTPHLAGRERVECLEGEPLVRMLEATFLGDYASVYLAFLHDEDPTPVQRIETLKKRLQSGA